MKIKKSTQRVLFVLLLLSVLVAVIATGCLNPSPAPQQPVDNGTEPTTPTVPQKYIKMEGTFMISYSDFYNNSSRIIAKEGTGNQIEWIVENTTYNNSSYYNNSSKNNSSRINETTASRGKIVITYYNKTVETHIPKLYYPENKTYLYVFNETGYEISATASGRYKDVVIKGEWG